MLKKSGFTLIELLIVVAIIAILAAIAVPNFLEAQVRAKASRAKSDLRTMITGLESYAVDHNQYPIPRITPDADPANNVTTPHSCTQFMPGGFSTVTFTPFGGGGARTGTFSGLTSPISYLTSVLPDPFVQNRFRSRIYEDLGYQNIRFWNENSLAATNPGENNTARLGNTFPNLYGAYIVRSLGPDRGYNPATIPYDPTNGTVSPGDIYRTGKREKNNTARGGE